MKHKALVAVLGMAVALGGCVSTPAPVEPVSSRLPGAVPKVLNAAITLLMERGYVIQHADGDLGRVEAVLGRWPGYRIQLEAQPAERGSRIEMTALRGGQPLPPRLLDPWLMTLRSRLGAE